MKHNVTGNKVRDLIEALNQVDQDAEHDITEVELLNPGSAYGKRRVYLNVDDIYFLNKLTEKLEDRAVELAFDNLEDLATAIADLHEAAAKELE
jgi:hypothetical protein